MRNEIKPIETVYDGYRFRSRLEARWAVFFNAAGIEYQYEPEGFVLPDGSWYLPDFYLPKVGGRAGKNGLWVEVKGRMTPTVLRTARLFAGVDECSEECRAGEHPLLLVGAIPRPDEIADDPGFMDGYWSCEYIDGDEYPVWFYRDPDTGKVEIWGWDNVKHDDNFGHGEGFSCFEACLDAARQARFEHGEKPKT